MASVFQNLTFQGGIKGAVDPFGFFGRGKKKSGGAPVLPEIDLPDWFQDEYYPKTQEDLYGLGSGLLKGEVPEYYAPIGEMGGDLFEDVISMISRDTVNSVEESAVRRNAGRSGAVNSAIAKAVSDKTVPLRWNDYLRAIQGREGLLRTGIGLEEGVRGAGLVNQSQRNAFNWDIYNAKVNERNTRYGIAANEYANKNAMTSDIIESLLSTAGTLGSGSRAASVDDILKYWRAA